MEVIGDCGCFFESQNLEESLVEVMQKLADDYDLVLGYRQKVTSRIENYYNWEWVTSFYVDLFTRLKNGYNTVQYDEFIDTQMKLV